ncbi:adenosine deaminase [bacterium]|nr:MAG: adenosine deaminase [bacterium]
MTGARARMRPCYAAGGRAPAAKPNSTMLESLRTLPKVQLHVHLEGTISPELLLALARRHGIDLKERAGLAPADLYRFKDFQEFLYLFRDVCQALKEPDDYGVLAASYARAAAAQGVCYAEVFISPSVWTWFHRQIDVRAVVEAIHDAFESERRRSGFEARLIADVTRNFGPARALKTITLVEGLMDLGIIGIGLGGDERNYPARDFGDAFAKARSVGLHTVAHAGEAQAAWSIREALEIGAERIGHGCAAADDAEVTALLAERNVCVEACPTSNALTGAWRAGEPHPLLSLDRAGVPIAIDSDDPALFSTTLLTEYARVAEMAGLDSVRRFARNAVVHSFAAGETKRELLARIDRHAASKGAGERGRVENQ